MTDVPVCCLLHGGPLGLHSHLSAATADYRFRAILFRTLRSDQVIYCTGCPDAPWHGIQRMLSNRNSRNMYKLGDDWKPRSQF